MKNSNITDCEDLITILIDQLAIKTDASLQQRRIWMNKIEEHERTIKELEDR